MTLWLAEAAQAIGSSEPFTALHLKVTLTLADKASVQLGHGAASR